MTDSRRIECQAAAWLASRDRGDWSEREQAQLDAWLGADTAHRVAWLRVASAWEQSDRLKALGAGVGAGVVPPRGHWTLSPFFDPQHALAASPDRASRTTDAKPATRWQRTLARGLAAASVLLLVVAAFVVFRYPPEPAVQPAWYQTGVGGSETVMLADGSQALLSSDTALSVALSRRERDIVLRRGEAFFSVHKDAQRPFVVSAGDYRVIAVGTRFAVRRDTHQMRVVVTRGLVRMESVGSADAPARTTMLPAGSVALVEGDAVQVSRLTIDAARRLLSWRDGYVSFHDTPLADAAAEFNRYNTRQLELGDPGIAALRVGGHFRADNIDAFVRLLEQVFPVRAEQQGDRTLLLAKKDGGGKVPPSDRAGRGKRR